MCSNNSANTYLRHPYEIFKDPSRYIPVPYIPVFYIPVFYIPVFYIPVPNIPGTYIPVTYIIPVPCDTASDLFVYYNRTDEATSNDESQNLSGHAAASSPTTSIAHTRGDHATISDHARHIDHTSRDHAPRIDYAAGVASTTRRYQRPDTNHRGSQPRTASERRSRRTKDR